MIEGNINFGVNIDLHYDVDYDEEIVDFLNKKITSDKFKNDIKDLLQGHIIDESCGNIEICDFKYNELKNVNKKIKLSQLCVGESFALGDIVYMLVNGNYIDGDIYVYTCFNFREGKYVAFADTEVEFLPEYEDEL